MVDCLLSLVPAFGHPATPGIEGQRGRADTYQIPYFGV